MFKDTWNPTPEEIKRWAYSKDRIPEQDWELALYSGDNISMICSFVEDPECTTKHRHFFLRCLYVYTGDIVRVQHSESMASLLDLLNQLEQTARSQELQAWITRSKELIESPENYTYAYWGLGSKYV